MGFERLYFYRFCYILPNPPRIENIVTIFFFAQILFKISQSSFPSFQTFSELFEQFEPPSFEPFENFQPPSKIAVGKIFLAYVSDD